MRLRPKASMFARWFGLVPTRPFTCVIFRAIGLCLLSCAQAQHTGWGDLFQGLATTCGNLFRADQLLQAVHGCADDVEGIIRAERLRQDVLDASALKHWTCSATSNNTGTRCGRLHHNDASCVATLDWVGDGAADHRNAEEVLASFLCTLLDSSRYFLSLAVANANHALAVANDDQCGERHVASTLDGLGDAVDGDNALDVLIALVVLRVTTIVATAAAATVVVVFGGASAVTLFTVRH